MASRKAKREPGRADRVIAFIENLTVPSGIGAGEPFLLRAWQKRWIRDIYEPRNPNGTRKVRRAILSMARKNGKTALVAALVLVHLIGPEAEPNGEIYSAANEREQAAIVFKVAAQMVRSDEDLKTMIRVVDSTKTMVCVQNGSVYRAISAEAGSKHGLNPSMVIYDELAQAKTRALYDVLDTSMGARQQPLFVVISTQSNDPKHILSELIDDGLRVEGGETVTHLYAVPDEADDIFDESLWPLANPALDDFRSLAEMREMAARAKRMPSFEATFRNLYLNQRIDAQSPLIPRAEWVACMQAGEGTRLRPGERIYLGLDLSATTDLCALVAVSAEDGDRVAAWFWKPGGLIEEHVKRDRAPYADWVRAGWIEAPEGRSIDYGYVAQRLGEISADYQVVGIAFDRWRIEQLLRDMRAQGVDAGIEGKDDPREGAIRLVPWGQGFRDMAPAIDAWETAVLQRTFEHDGNPVLTFCVSNAISVMDPSGNRKLDKSKTRFRIDGAVATAMAIGAKVRDLAVDAPTDPVLMFV